MAIQKAIQKSGILSPWRNPLDPGDRFYRRVSAITRAIMNFNGTQYATLSEAVVLDGDFEIEWAGSVTGVDADQVIANTELYAKLRVAQSGHAQFLVGDGSGWLSNTLLSSTRIDDGKLHTVSVTRVDETYYLAVDGQIEITETVAGCDVQMSTLFRRSSANAEYMKGAPFSLKIWKNGDRNTGELVTDLRFDEPDTVYQRNYASPIADENDPDWSGAILQNALPGDWEEISKQSSDDFWLGVDESTTADLSRAGSSDDCEVFLENGSLRIVSYTTNPAWIGAHFSNLKSGPLYQVSFIADEFAASSGLEIIGSSDTDVLTGFQSIDVITVTSRISVRDRDGHSAGDEYYLHGISIRRKLKYAEGAL